MVNVVKTGSTYIYIYDSHRTIKKSKEIQRIKNKMISRNGVFSLLPLLPCDGKKTQRATQKAIDAEFLNKDKKRKH